MVLLVSARLPGGRGRPLPGRRDAPLPGRRAASPRRAVSLRTPSRRRRDGNGLGGARSRARAVRRCEDPARISGGEAARFRREARAAARFLHPNLAMILTSETWRGVPVLIFEYLEGGTLAQRRNAGVSAPADVAMGSAPRRSPPRRPRRRGAPSGRQALQHRVHGGRGSEAPRLRSRGRVRRRRRAGVGRRGRRRRPSRALDGADRLAPHPIERDRRNPSVPLSGGGGRQSGRALLRPLGVDAVALRGGHGTQSVPRGNRARDAREDPHAAHPGPARAQARLSGRARGGAGPQPVSVPRRARANGRDPEAEFLALTTAGNL